MQITAYELAQRFVGMALERPGEASHPLISWWLSLCSFGLDAPDETPWCSAFVNGIAWELRLPRSKSAVARSWLTVGTPVLVEDARVGFDIVVLNRGGDPSPDNLTSKGHVGFFSELAGEKVGLLSGNTANNVSLARFSRSDILGVRRLAA